MQDEDRPVIGRPAGLGRTLDRRAVGLVYFSPVIWMILAAFKTRADALATPPKLFFTPTLEHFWASFHRVSADGTRVMRHRARCGTSPTASQSHWSASAWRSRWAPWPPTALRGCASSGATISCSIFSSCAWFRPITAIIPLYFLFRVTGLGGSYIAIILVYTAFNLPFAIWMLRSFIDELHLPIEEAARLDGSSELKILWRICLPQMQAGNRGHGDHRVRVHLERFSVQPALDERRHANRAGRDDAGGRRGRGRGLGRVRRNRHDLPRADSAHCVFPAKSAAARAPHSARFRGDGARLLLDLPRRRPNFQALSQPLRMNL